MTSICRLLVQVFALAAVSDIPTARAEVSVYTNSASFSSVASNLFTDTFDDLPIQAMFSSTLRVNGPYTYTVSAAGGLFPAGTSADVWMSTTISGRDLEFTGFSGEVRAVGGWFFGTDLSGAFVADQLITVSAVDASGALASITLNGATLTSFAGFVSSDSLLLSVRVSIANEEVWATANNLSVASGVMASVPEPSAWITLIAALPLVGTVTRRRKVERLLM
jgi:hypothetical protein